MVNNIEEQNIEVDNSFEVFLCSELNEIKSECLNAAKDKFKELTSKKRYVDSSLVFDTKKIHSNLITTYLVYGQCIKKCRQLKRFHQGQMLL